MKQQAAAAVPIVIIVAVLALIYGGLMLAGVSP